MGEAKNLREESRSIISQMVHALFVPVFFVNIGLKLDFVANFDPFLVLLITFVGIIGRYLGARIGTMLSSVPKVNRVLISIAHTPGGMMEIVVALMALELKLITPQVFIAIVVSAVVSSILMGPWMSFALRKRKKVKISDFMDLNRGIIYVKANNKKDAIIQILEAASKLLKNLPFDEMLDQILQRESVFSTSIGNGIAIPHIRTDNINEPFLMLGVSKNGIDWNSMDGKPVHLIFFLLSPATTNDLHIEILSKIATIFQKNENLEKFIVADSSKELKPVIESLGN